MRALTRRQRRTSGSEVRFFFTTDIHGSDRCLRKFLNAGAFYGVDYLVLGGDITGKSLVPIWRDGGGWSADYNDRHYERVTERECEELQQLIRDNGQYPVTGEIDELLALEDEQKRDAAFLSAIRESIGRWVELAEQRLRGSGIRCFITPGNDDFWDIDDILAASDIVEFVEGKCVRLSDDHEMITTGYSNLTPWDSPRELPEDRLRERLESMYGEAVRPEGLICVLHAPPRGTLLDQAPEIDENFIVQMEGGEPRLTAVGSQAVREFIDERQPLLGLHGHVHESKATQMLGRTLVINPGSEYREGSLTGALVTVDRDRVVSHQLVAG
jgi:uncharacterized protein